MPKINNEKNIALNIENNIEEDDSLSSREQIWPAKEEEGELAIDVYQTPEEIILESTIAGVEPKDLDISITNDMVTIRGKRERKEKIKTEDFFFQECFWGAFSRSIVLPQEVDADKAKAVLKNGVLNIRLPKLERTKTKKLKIETDAE